MAVLTDLDKTEIKRNYFVKGQGKEEFKGTNPSMSGVQLLAVLQAIEDKWEADRTAYKTVMDAASGTTLTNAQAKILGRGWLAWKVKRGG